MTITCHSTSITKKIAVGPPIWLATENGVLLPLLFAIARIFLRLMFYEAAQMRDIFVEFGCFLDGQFTRSRQVDCDDLADHGRAR